MGEGGKEEKGMARDACQRMQWRERKKKKGKACVRACVGALSLSLSSLSLRVSLSVLYVHDSF